MNHCIFGGNFVRDPEFKKIGDNNTSLAKFSLALNRVFKKDGEKKREVDFLEFEAWDKHADNISAYCHKGDYILVYASARQQSWEDNEQKKRSKIVFRVEGFEFVGGKARREETEVQPQEQQSEEIPF
jgi:single-strand DNA-binding protein